MFTCSCTLHWTACKHIHYVCSTAGPGVPIVSAGRNFNHRSMLLYWSQSHTEHKLSMLKEIHFNAQNDPTPIEASVYSNYSQQANNTSTPLLFYYIRRIEKRFHNYQSPLWKNLIRQQMIETYRLQKGSSFFSASFLYRPKQISNLPLVRPGHSFLSEETCCQHHQGKICHCRQ